MLIPGRQNVQNNNGYEKKKTAVLLSLHSYHVPASQEVSSLSLDHSNKQMYNQCLIHPGYSSLSAALPGFFPDYCAAAPVPPSFSGFHEHFPDGIPHRITDSWTSYPDSDSGYPIQ